MAKGIKTGGGSRAGKPNKKSLELAALLEANGMNGEYDHPVLWMYKVGSGQVTFPVVVGETIVDMEASPEIRTKCMSEVSQYIEAKRKAMDIIHSGDSENPVVTRSLIPELTKDEWLKAHGIAG